MNKAVIYTRVSTNDQSVSNQLKVLREIADKKGLNLLKKSLTKALVVQKAEMREKGSMNSLRVLSEKSSTLFSFGMCLDLVVH